VIHRRFRFRQDTSDTLRRRMIAETELALTLGLIHPESVPRIPTVEVGVGAFHPLFAERWWAQTLDVDLDELSRDCAKALGTAIRWTG
jgi:hypothetical protein